MTLPVSTSAVGPVPWTGGNALATLDAESMIVYCQSQLADVDSQVQALTREQELAVARKKAVQTVSNAYAAAAAGTADGQAVANAYHVAIESLPPGDPARIELEQKMEAVGLGNSHSDAEIDAAMADAAAAARQQCIEDYAPPVDLHDDYDPSTTAAHLEYEIGNAEDQARAETKAAMAASSPSKEACDAAVSDLKSIAERIGGDAEISMIRLQSLVSARQTMVGLVTNMMAKVQSGEKSIVDNIR